MNTQPSPERMMLVRVDPQPTFIESSGRWKWPLKPPYDNDGRCTSVVTASREWWEYVPSGAKPHEWAEGVQLRDDVWYWAVPATSVEQGQAMECRSLGCQRPAADKIIQEVRTQNTALINECLHYRQKLRDLSAAATAALMVTKS